MAAEVFLNEFNWLQNNIPEALDLQGEHPVYAALNNELSQIRVPELDAFTIEPIEPENLLFFEEGQQSFEFPEEGPSNKLLDYVGDPLIETTQLDEIICEFGTEAFGVYLPMHRYFNNKHTGWGIYLFPEIINAQAAKLAKEFSNYISHKKCMLLYTYCVYRHELFHFQTELFATGMEIAMRKPLYLNYNSEVFTKYANTEDWLEEALAEASVLSSRLVSKRSGNEDIIKRYIYSKDLERMPPGYRHHRCTKYGGVKKAMQVLAAQILHLNNTHPLPTDLVSIKSNFSVKDNKVPLYFVKGVNTVVKVDRRSFR